MNRLIAKELLLIAKSLIADEDYDYIYDPDHKKKPGGGYVKTDMGWSKGKDETVREVEKNTYGDELNQVNQIAKNPKTSPETLDELSRSKDLGILARVATNPNTSSETLTRLTKNKNVNIKIHAINNPNTPIEAVEQRVNDKSRGDLVGAVTIRIGEESKNSQLLGELVHKRHVAYHQFFAKNPNTPPEALDYIVNNKDRDIGRDYSEKGDPWVEMQHNAIVGVINNKNTSRKTLQHIVDNGAKVYSDMAKKQLG